MATGLTGDVALAILEDEQNFRAAVKNWPKRKIGWEIPKRWPPLSR